MRSPSPSALDGARQREHDADARQTRGEREQNVDNFASHHFTLDQLLDAYDTVARAAETKALKLVIDSELSAGRPEPASVTHREPRTVSIAALAGGKRTRYAPWDSASVWVRIGPSGVPVSVLAPKL